MLPQLSLSLNTDSVHPVAPGPALGVGLYLLPREFMVRANVDLFVLLLLFILGFFFSLKIHLSIYVDVTSPGTRITGVVSCQVSTLNHPVPPPALSKRV